MSRDYGYLFADALAVADAEDQAAFLNRFAHGLRTFGESRREGQLCYIAEHLDGCGSETIKSLAAFIDLENETRREQRAREANLRAEIGRLEERKREIEAEVAAVEAARLDA